MAALSTRKDELGDIRKAASGATRDIKKFERALAQLRRRGVRAIQQEAQVMRKTMANRYQRLGLYADKRGALRRIRKPGKKWNDRKKDLKLDPRPGIARKGVLKTLQSPRVISKRTHGFVYDLKIPAITVTGRATLGKSERNVAGKRIMGGTGKTRSVIGTAVKRMVTNRRSFAVNSYIDHFADMSAPGLGSLSGEDKKKLDRVALEAVNKHLADLGEAGRRRLGDTSMLKFTVRSERLTNFLTRGRV